MTGADHEHSESVTVGAMWLADQNPAPQPIVPALRSRFGLSALEACVASRRAVGQVSYCTEGPRLTIHRNPYLAEGAEEKFAFSNQARRFPVVDARPYRWPTTSSAAGELIEDWRANAGLALADHKLSKATMGCIASHTSRKDGTCPLSDRALASRSGRSIPSTKRDIGRLKKMGFLIAEVEADKGYRQRRRLLKLSVPDRVDGDQRISPNDNQRIPTNLSIDWGSTYGGYVDLTDKGERRND